MSKLIQVKASVYKKHMDCLNNRQQRFSKERNHLAEVYCLEKSLVDRVMDNMLNVNKHTNEVVINEEMIPDYNYEKEMLYSYQDFKDELMYDGMFELSKMLSLHDFYSLFSPYYCPAF
jgi:hypothetical protein